MSKKKFWGFGEEEEEEEEEEEKKKKKKKKQKKNWLIDWLIDCFKSS